MEVEDKHPRTPPPNLPIQVPITPTNICIGRTTLRGVWRGYLDLETAYFKTQKALELAQAKNLMLKHQMNGLHQAAELDKASTIQLGKARFHQGQFFDPSYQISHEQQLVQPRAREKAARAARKGKSRAVDPPEVPNLVSMQAGPSITHSVDESLFECIELEI